MNGQHKVSSAQFKIAKMVAARAGDILEVSSEEVLRSLTGRIHPHVLEIAIEAAGARFWRFGAKFFFEDCAEGEDPINFDDLRYDSEIGLHSVDEIDD